MQVQLHNFLILKRFFYQKKLCRQPKQSFVRIKLLPSPLKNQARTPFSSKTFWLEASHSVFLGRLLFCTDLYGLKGDFCPRVAQQNLVMRKIFLRRSTKKRRRRNSFLLPFLRIFVIARYRIQPMPAAGSLGDDAADLVFKAAGFIVDDASGKLN